VPKTAALQQQKLFSMGSQEGWWFEKLRDGRIAAEHQGWREDVTVLDCTTTSWRTAASSTSPGGAPPSPSARPRVVHAAGVAAEVPGQLAGRVQVMPNGEKKMIPRPYWYKVPTLKACREFWDSHFGGPYDWPDIEQKDTKSLQPPAPF
jgi:hypothetical protein